MSLSFLPDDVRAAVSHLNYNKLTEIRLRRGQPVIVQYDGLYSFLGKVGIVSSANDGIRVSDIMPVLNAATGGFVYGYTEQMKNGFITVGHGVRIGIAGEYVTEKGAVNTIKNATSLNIRIPHDIEGCAEYLFKTVFSDGLKSTVIFSKPGLGKTTMLRDIARRLSQRFNVLVFDERGEIAALNEYGDGFNLGAVDVVRCYSKLGAISSAIRAMKPDVIITDELYGDEDMRAVQFAVDCGITVIASSHVSDKEKLKKTPFDVFIKLTQIGAIPEIYDKNFNSYCDCCADDGVGRVSFGG